LDCEKCEARLATINNDNELRKEVADKWSKLNNITITPEMINCEGCRIDGKKTVFCDKLCKIRQCAISNKYETCGECPEMKSCKKVAMVIGNNAESLKNLENINYME
jgi:hypothetical protein